MPSNLNTKEITYEPDCPNSSESEELYYPKWTTSRGEEHEKESSDEEDTRRKEVKKKRSHSWEQEFKTPAMKEKKTTESTKIWQDTDGEMTITKD